MRTHAHAKCDKREQSCQKVGEKKDNSSSSSFSVCNSSSSSSCSCSCCRASAITRAITRAIISSLSSHSGEISTENEMNRIECIKMNKSCDQKLRGKVAPRLRGGSGGRCVCACVCVRACVLRMLSALIFSSAYECVRMRTSVRAVLTCAAVDKICRDDADRVSDEKLCRTDRTICTRFEVSQSDFS